MSRLSFFTFAIFVLLILGVSSSGCSKVRRAADRSDVNQDDGEPVERIGAQQPGKPPKQQNVPAAKVQIERKIIYTANIQISVENVDKTSEKLATVIKQHNAYIQRADIQGAVGSRRTATWTLRVPVEQFNEFRTALMKLGEPQRNSINSEEVTEEFYDLTKRIANEKRYEERLLELLKVKTEKLKDVIQIEDKLAAVREKIEVMEGRLNRLQHRTSLSTVILTATERDQYAPDQSPSFGTSISRAFSGSINALVTCGKAIVLIAVASAPWFVLIGVPMGLVWWRVRRHRDTAAAPADSTNEENVS